MEYHDVVVHTDIELSPASGNSQMLGIPSLTQGVTMDPWESHGLPMDTLDIIVPMEIAWAHGSHVGPHMCPQEYVKSCNMQSVIDHTSGLQSSGTPRLVLRTNFQLQSYDVV